MIIYILDILTVDIIISNLYLIIFWFSKLEVFNITFYLTQVDPLNREKDSAVSSFFDEIKYYSSPIPKIQL